MCFLNPIHFFHSCSTNFSVGTMVEFKEKWYFTWNYISVWIMKKGQNGNPKTCNYKSVSATGLRIFYFLNFTWNYNPISMRLVGSSSLKHYGLQPVDAYLCLQWWWAAIHLLLAFSYRLTHRSQWADRLWKM